MYALYARQSVEKQDSISVESQLDFCRYETRGEPYMTFVDRGFSGKDTNRPAFERMLEEVRAGKLTKVVVYKLDRISRSILDFSNMMETFRQYGVEFISSTEKFDTSTPIGRAMLNICIVFAQLERETIQRRVADAYAARSKKGFYMGGRVPYGFSREPVVIGGVRTSRFIPVEAECEQIRLMYRMYADPANSLGDVARRLRECGMEHLRGGTWSTPRISELLRSPVYVRADAEVYAFFKGQGTAIVNPAADFTGENGCYLFRGEAKGKSQLAGKELVLAPHAGIISGTLWLRCRRRCLENRRAAQTCKAKNSWLSGKVKCKKCGYALTVAQSATRWKRYFVCSRCARGCPGTGGTVYAEVLEEYLARAIGEKLAEIPALAQFQEPDPADNIRKLRLAALDEEISQLLDKVPDAGKTMMRYLEERVEALDQERAGLLTPPPETPGKRILDHTARWLDAPFSMRQAVVDVLVDVIHIGDGKIEIDWKL